MQLETKIALFGGLIPGAVALAVLLPAWRRAGRRSGDDQGGPRRGPFWLAPLCTIVILTVFMYLSWREIKLNGGDAGEAEGEE